MCDTLCALTRAGTLFAKNSDRPGGEIQLPEVHPGRPAGGRVRTQYLEVDDEGACAVLLSRPDWLWGAEHGLNEHGVAIGNEKVHTVSGVDGARPALIGMDLVRLGLERAVSAEQAVDVMVGLLERHGQGGIADAINREAYDSSFLVADRGSAWVLETAGRTWVARPVPAPGATALSNRLTVRTDWTRASGDVAPGADFEEWRDTAVDTGSAEGRLAASRRFLRGAHGRGPAGASVTVRQVVGHLRDHGTGPWGEPGYADGSGAPVDAVPPPTETGPDGKGLTVCMHADGLLATTASMVALLPRPGDGPLRSWLAVGSPCVAVFVPVLGVPDVGGFSVDAGLWHDNAELRRRVEADGDELCRLREVLAPLEAELWVEADDVADHPERWSGFHAGARRRVRDAARRLAGR
jgi:secernin